MCLLLVSTGCVLEEDTFSTPSLEQAQEKQEQSENREHDYPRLTVPLVRVIDGDTVKVMVNGEEENIRFLLVDTPETNHPRMNGPQPFGPEAKDFMEKLLKDAEVEIELDVSERDRYRRILAYVYADGVLVQEELLRAGLARVAYIFPPNTRYVDRFQSIQKEAQEKAVGIWSVENYAQEDGFYPEFMEDIQSNEQKEQVKNSQNCTIKGNINSKGEKIYHIKSGAFYDRTIPEECFDTEDEAVAAGYRKSKR
ncbi:thermonuclease family protein [Sutcliffiella rhizosphaerae]|nr:thermonuclease family protein [Sutcliffiella rhizosphaerae]